MKLKHTTIAVLAALPLMSSAVFAATPTAQELTDRVYGSIFAEKYSPDSDKTRSATWLNQDNGNGQGLNIGYRVSPNWSIRAEYARQELSRKSTSTSIVKGNRVGLDLGYHIDDLPIYLLAGVKNFTAGPNASAANLGFGVNMFVHDDVSFFLEANRYQGISKSFVDHGIKFGVSYFFGDSPAPAPTPAPEAPAIGDADQDGVTDDKDQCANTPTTDKVDAVGCSIFTEKSVSFQLNAQFDNDSAVVKQQYHADIEKLADFLKRFPNTDVEIGGHASNVGTPAYNLGLSQRRADAIANVLVNNYGIDGSRVKAVGYGITQPKASGNTKAAHAVNRRIEAVVTASVKETVQR